MYEKEIKQYISTLTVTETNRTRYRRDITDFISLLSELGLTSPTKTAYQEFAERRQVTQNDKGVKESLNRVKKFFEFLLSKERQINMFENEAINSQEVTGVTATEAQAESVSAIQEGEAKSPKKRGPKTNGENKTGKIMIYVTPSLQADIQDLSHLKGTSIADFVSSIIADYVKDKQDKLQAFRALKNEI